MPAARMDGTDSHNSRTGSLAADVRGTGGCGCGGASGKAHAQGTERPGAERTVSPTHQCDSTVPPDRHDLRADVVAHRRRHNSPSVRWQWRRAPTHKLLPDSCGTAAPFAPTDPGSEAAAPARPHQN